MATKKITELQLISAITGGENIPADNGLQTYRATINQIKSFILANENILLAMLKNDIFHGLTSVTPASDDYFILNDTSDSNKTKKALVSTFVQNLYRNVSSYPATVTSTDGTLRLSGSSGTITLPAAGNAGRKYKFIHAGTSITQVYTLATTGGSVFKTPNGDVASGSFALHTKGEMVEWEDDGTDWVQTARYARTGWVNAGAITFDITSGGTAPTKATTKVIDEQWWMRDGENIIVRGSYSATNLTGAADGSGDYVIVPPGGVTLDTSKVRTFDTVKGWNVVMNRSPVCGHVHLAHLTGATAVGTVIPYSAKNGVRMAVINTSGQGGMWSSTGYNLALTGGINVDWEYKHPVSGWQP